MTASGIFKFAGAWSRLGPWLALVLLGLLAAAPVWGDPTPAPSPREVTAVVLRDFPPDYVVGPQGQPSGMAIELLNEVAQRAGLRVSYLFRDNWGEVIEALASGQADLCPYLAAVPQRREKLDFTAPLARVNVGLVVRADNSHISDLSDLHQRRVGVVTQSAAWALLRDRKDISLIQIAKTSEALLQLLSGQVDALAVPEQVIVAMAHQSGLGERIKIVGQPLLTIDRVMAVRKGNAELLGHLDPAVNDLVASNQYRQIYDRWYGITPPYWTAGRILWAMIWILLASILIMALWRYLSVKRLNLRLLASIDERRNAERKAAELAAIVATSEESIISLDQQGRIITWNQGAEHLYGYGAAEAIGQTMALLTPQDGRPPDMDYLTRAQAGQRIIQHETSGQTKDGRLLDVSVTLSPLLDEQGHQIGVSCIARDISLRKQSERSLRESEERFNKVFRNSPAWISLSTLAEGRYLDTNEAYQKGTGWRAEEIVGRTSYEINLWNDPRQRDQGLRILEQQGHLREFPVVMRKKTGELVYGTWSAERIEIGELTCLVSVINDLTQRKLAEEEVRRSEAKYKALVETTDTGFVILDPEGRVLDANQEYARMSGRGSPAEIIGHSVLEWTHPADHERNRIEVGKCLESGFVRNLEISYRLPNGQSLPLEIHATVLEDNGNKVILSMCRDISERHRVQEALRESENNLRSIFDTLHAGIIYGDTEGRLLLGNQYMADMFGYSLSELVGMPYLRLVDPQQAADSRDKLRGLIEGSIEHVFGERLYLRKDGSTFWGQLSAKRTNNPDGSFKGLVGIITDITAHKQAQSELREREERDRGLVEGSFDGIWVQKGPRIIFANQRLHQMLGYANGELEGLDHWLVYHPEDQELARVRAQARMRGEQVPERYEVRARRKDGSSFAAEISAKPITMQGQPGIQVWLRDISDRKLAEETLKQSEARFKALSEESPLGVSLIDLDNRYRYLNPAFIKMFGYTLEDIATGADWFTRAYPDENYRREVIQAWREDLASYPEGVSRQRTFVVTCKDGGSKIIMFRPVTIAHHGQFVLYEDITERRRAEESLRQSEARYRLLADNVIDVIWILDLATLAFSYISPSVARQRGYTPEEALRQPLADTLTPDSLELAAQVIAEELEREHDGQADPNRIRTLELESPCKDGSTLWTEVSCSFLRDADGNPVAIMGITRDISERRQAQEQIRQSQENYRLILEAAPDPMVLYDMEGRVVYVNPAFTRVFGWSLEEVAGQQIDYVPEEEKPLTRQMLDLLQQGREAHSFETRRLDKQGNLLDIALSWSVWRDQKGSHAGTVITLRNITEQKHLENQLRQAQKMEAIGTLAGGIAHDFNNLLSVILGYADRAQDRSEQRLGNDYEIAQIINAAQRAAQLVQQILTFSRRGHSVKRPSNLNREIEQVIEMLGRTIPKMVTIDSRLAPDLGLINCDLGQVELVVLNLANNAVDAMPDGGRLIFSTRNTSLDEAYCRQHPEAKPGPYVLLEISDTGTGIGEETRQHIFEPFYTTKEIGKGTGLGLSSVYGIVTDHGGHIHCYSELGVGTTMKVYWPLHQGEAAQERRQEATPMSQLPGTERLLLVDDEDALRDMAAESLRAMGYEVLTADSGEQALQVLGGLECFPDLVILDLGMPGMGGRRCLKEILALDPAAKVLIASGYTVNGVRDEAMSEGAAGFLGKPFRVMELLSTVRKVLDGR